LVTADLAVPCMWPPGLALPELAGPWRNA
jgi:hypothetical protein